MNAQDLERRFGPVDPAWTAVLQARTTRPVTVRKKTDPDSTYVTFSVHVEQVYAEISITKAELDLAVDVDGLIEKALVHTLRVVP